MRTHQTYHAYVFGTSFWYFLRGIVRVIDPATVSSTARLTGGILLIIICDIQVCGWFRPPVDGLLVEPNDLELYTTRTDAFCLLALAAILLAVSDALPLPGAITGSSLSDYAPVSYKKPYARAVILITILHHVATGVGAYSHWCLESHRTIAMDIGRW